MLILGTVPVGLAGLVGEHWFRTTLGKPVPTAVFLIINGAVLLGAEQLRRRDVTVDSDYVDERVSGPESDKRLAELPAKMMTSCLRARLTSSEGRSKG